MLTSISSKLQNAAMHRNEQFTIIEACAVFELLLLILLRRRRRKDEPRPLVTFIALCSLQCFNTGGWVVAGSSSS